MGKNSKYNSLKYLAFVSQLGLSVILPVIFCIFIGMKIKEWLNLGNIVVILSILIGIFMAGLTFMKFMDYIQREAKRSQEQKEDF